jgi:hypothetical protein
MWTTLVWNMGLGSVPRRNASRNWGRLSELMEQRSVDVALLNEASVPVPDGLMARYSESGTSGRDRLANDQTIQRPWSTAVVSAHEQPEAVDAHAVGMGSHPRRPNIPFEPPSRPGSWTAGVVLAPGIGRVTCVALYGLLEELSDASVHRSLSEISPIFSDPDYKELALVGGDLNTSTAWKDPLHRARDQGVLDRFEAYGLVDCLRRVRGSKRLEGCTCVFGDECRHTWTRRDPRSPEVPYQMDYLFASTVLAERLKSCEALSPLEWQEYSDHSPIIATFA